MSVAWLVEVSWIGICVSSRPDEEFLVTFERVRIGCMHILVVVFVLGGCDDH